MKSAASFAQAEADYRRALELQPGNPLPLALLGTLLRGQLPDLDLAALEQGLSDESVRTETRARLAFALGHVLDARGEYARAAKWIREANALTLESRRGQNDFVPPTTSVSSTTSSSTSTRHFSPERAEWARNHAGRSSSSACRDRGRR